MKRRGGTSKKSEKKGSGQLPPSSNPPSELLETLLTHYQSGHCDAAEALAAKISLQYPKHPFAWKVLGALWLSSGRIHEALSPFQRTVELSPLDPEAYLNMAAVLRSLEQLNEAEKYCREAIRIDPSRTLALYNLGVILSDLNRPLEALESYERVISLEPDHESTLLNLSALLISLERFAEAEIRSSHLVALRPNNGRAHQNRSTALRGLGRLDEAVASYSRAIQFMPDDAGARCDLGKVLHKMGRLIEAETICRQAIHLDPSHAEAHLVLAIACQDLGKLAESELAYAEASRLKPDMVELSSSLLDFVTIVELGTTIPHPVVDCEVEINNISFSIPECGEIKDDSLLRLLAKVSAVISANNAAYVTECSQVFRRNSVDLDCERHLTVFAESQVIPEYCFGCYKVQVQVESVMDLIKLYLLFDRVQLGFDNIRKCMIELREEFAGFYKGFIYCSGFDEAEEIAKKIRPVALAVVAKEVLITIKRGCSEYGLLFPEYTELSHDDQQIMQYPISWRSVESKHDAKTPGRLMPKRGSSVPGLHLQDILTIHNWISYAKGLGDDSAAAIEQGELFSRTFFDHGKTRKESFPFGPQ
ncbi:MAG: tetratricopeptide repeat protein [Luminiphilus sp.]|nr:tetratricopeptide repeat protein [Luminiphilus sp.]